MKRFAGNDTGVAILELALTAPFLILMTIGIIDIGRFARDGIEVGNAARAGASFGAYDVANSTSTNGIASAATSDASDVSLLATEVASSTYCSCGQTPGTHVASCSPVPTCASGDHLDAFVSVTVVKAFSPSMAYPGLPATITVSRTATQEISP